MKLNEAELVLVGLIILYIAFFTHPPPPLLVEAFKSPVGHALALGGILYVIAYQSFIIGLFLALAYVMTNCHFTEYMTDTPSSKKETKKEKEQPTSSGIPPPAVTGVIESLMKKGDRLPQHSSKKGDTLTKPEESAPPKASHSKSLEHFGNF